MASRKMIEEDGLAIHRSNEGKKEGETKPKKETLLLVFWGEERGYETPGQSARAEEEKGLHQRDKRMLTKLARVESTRRKHQITVMTGKGVGG